jgi:hypothetical protein
VKWINNLTLTTWVGKRDMMMNLPIVLMKRGQKKRKNGGKVIGKDRMIVDYNRG